MSTPFAEKIFKSFDGSESTSGKLYFPDRYRILENVFKESGTFSIQGAGLSFPALSFGAESSTIQLGQFNRFLAFDENTGLIEVETGMTLGALAEMTIPKGWYLKVQPGHPSISIGGCLGADVHGKNQFQDLNFKEQVQFLKLYHPDKGYIYCDRTQNENLFHLTCGGWGLTGVILSVGIKLGRLKSSQIQTETIPFNDIFELPQLLQARSQTEDLIYTWHDFNTSKNWGRGFLKTGRYSSVAEEAASLEKDLKKISMAAPLNAETRGLPMNLLCPLGTFALNMAFSTKELYGRKQQTQSLVEFLFPVINKTIYYDFFGKKGFHESQVLIPTAQFSAVMKELQQGLKKFPVPITLASCKQFKGQRELLRFIGDGIVLAMNFPRSQDSVKLLKWWDEIVIHNNGLPNISKDSRLPLQVVEKTFPELHKFKSDLRAWDSQRLFQNSLSKRLEL